MGHYTSGNAITVDVAGNVYVAGGRRDTTITDYLTVKYDSSGAMQWDRTYGKPSTDISAYAIAVDKNGNAYVVGKDRDSVTGHNAYGTIKYNSSGNTMWVKTYSTGAGSLPTSMALDSSGNVYVAGECGIVKYDGSGDTIWTSYAGVPISWARIVIDKNNNVYVTGIIDSATNYDYITAKYSGEGVEEQSSVISNQLSVTAQPNPFRGKTTIKYSVPVTTEVSLKVYDSCGRCVKTLAEGTRAPGNYNETLDAKDYPAGIYFAKFVAGDYKEIKKLILMK